MAAGTEESEVVTRIELFNIARDPNEQTDLSRKEPERVHELLARLQSYVNQALAPKGRRGPAPDTFKMPKVWGEPDPPREQARSFVRRRGT